jgi:anaerobic magnesium-protoporphyrin IX monomethyl ester cyclase
MSDPSDTVAQSTPLYTDLSANARFKVLFVYSNSPMDNLMPMSIASLAGALRKNGFNTKLFDTTYYPMYDLTGPGAERKESLQVAEFSYKEVGIEFITTDIYEDFRACVEEYQPDLIALSTVEPTHLLGIALLNAVKDLEIPTIVGGCHAIFSPTHVFEEDCVDIVGIGEGEECLVELCTKMANKEDYTSIGNLWIKHGGKEYKNEKTELKDIDHLPHLDFSIFDPKRVYRPMDGRLWRMAPIEFSRGCMYKCTYCSAPRFATEFEEQGDWLRHKSMKNIQKEMEAYIEEYNIEYFYFVSETFLGIPDRRFKEFCNMYKSIGIPFWFNTRPETLRENKIKMLEDIGCHRLSVGLEMGNEQYRKTILQRPVSNDRMINALKMVSESSIQLSVNNIIGFPDETREMIFETIYLNRQVDAKSYSCYVFQPYRGTDLYDYTVKKGYYDPKRIAKTFFVDSPLKQPHITPQEISGLQRTFPLYIKLPESDFHLIRKAEKFDEEGNRMYEELTAVFRELEDCEAPLQ